MERDGEAGGEDGCASGGRHQEPSEGDGGTSLAVMEADVLWSNGSCVCLPESVCLSQVCLCLSVFVCAPVWCLCLVWVCAKCHFPLCVCTVCVFLVEALQLCDGCIKAMWSVDMLDHTGSHYLQQQTAACPPVCLSVWSFQDATVSLLPLLHPPSSFFPSFFLLMGHLMSGWAPPSLSLHPQSLPAPLNVSF